MSLNQSTPTSAAAGRRYWRSLDELADTPEFKEWLHREFPQGAGELMEDGQSRRHFLKIMSASFALAGVATLGAGCRRPEETLATPGQSPGNHPIGEARYFATAMPTRTGAIPLVVKSYEGRPIKIEGNALFPGGNGGTDGFAQASLLDLYDPDRARHFKHDGQVVTREAALNFLDRLSKKFAANGGEGLAFLAESSTSPSRARLQRIIAARFPKSQWFTYDAIDSGIHQRAATQAFGQPVKPVFHFDRAKVILSLDCDFLGGEDGAHEHIRKFATGRKAEQGMSRLYTVESLFTLTGANADHRLRVAASGIAEIAELLFRLVSGAEVPAPTNFDGKWILECASDLSKHKGEVLVVAGQRQPIEVHLLAYAINSALNSISKTITLIPASEATQADLRNASVSDTLVILGGNPAYNSPMPALHAEVQASPTIVRLGYYEDESTRKTWKSQWLFPAAHYLESWGDAVTADGALVPLQPLIEPLFGGLTELEFLARIAGETINSSNEIVRATFGDSEADWRKFLFNGFTTKAVNSLENVRLDEQTLIQLALPKSMSPVPLSKGCLEVVFYRDAKVDDGRYANNGWMQELPDPITKLTWGNAVLVSRKTARELGVANGDVVEITLHGRHVEGPIWTQPGMADYSLGLALGYGRERAGRVGTDVGFNVYPIFSGKYIETGATIRKTGKTRTLACVQHHWSMEDRPAVREANLAEFLSEPKFAQEKFHEVEPPIVQSLYPNPLDEAKKMALHQWGMVIDLNTCVGCGACVIACQSENNIPIVGKDQVLRGREMHWLRIDRYFTSEPARRKNSNPLSPSAELNQADGQQQFAEWIDDVQAVNQPMLCQQCEAAPCENVCPVNATVHDQEGLNVMAYSRCIGSRFCSVNCPYKVRRFNYLDFNKRPRTEKTEDEWDLIKLSKNPDVTVRMRGVMEKCTYCTQRIEHAKIAQKAKAGASGNVRLSEAASTVPKTACQQVCPAGAIVFGDVSDEDSTVAKLKLLPRNYSVLGELLTKPRTTYLARIRNPNPAMPDYHAPFSTEEYEGKKI